MIHGSEGATTLLGMPEFVVGAQIQVGGEWWLAVETIASMVGARGAAPGRWATAAGG